MIISTEAIVLSTIKYGDTSKIVSLYTRADGKISVIAKSARAAKNKYGASLEPMSLIKVNYYKKSATGLHLLSDAELISQSKGLLSSLDIMSCGLAIVEASKITQDEGEQNVELFELITSSLLLLNTEPKNPFSIFLFFLIGLCHIMGFELDFGVAETRASNYSKNFFSLADGCIISYERSIHHNSIKISATLIKVLAELSSITLTESTSVNINDNQRKEAINFFEKYISYHLENSINFRSYELVDY